METVTIMQGYLVLPAKFMDAHPHLQKMTHALLVHSPNEDLLIDFFDHKPTYAPDDNGIISPIKRLSKTDRRLCIRLSKYLRKHGYSLERRVSHVPCEFWLENSLNVEMSKRTFGAPVKAAPALKNKHLTETFQTLVKHVNLWEGLDPAKPLTWQTIAKDLPHVQDALYNLRLSTLIAQAPPRSRPLPNIKSETLSPLQLQALCAYADDLDANPILKEWIDHALKDSGGIFLGLFKDTEEFCIHVQNFLTDVGSSRQWAQPRISLRELRDEFGMDVFHLALSIPASTTQQSMRIGVHYPNQAAEK